MPVRLVVQERALGAVDARELSRRARSMLSAVQRRNAELSIVLTDDDQIQKLNRVYRKKNRPTDVLAFAMAEGEFGDMETGLLGDVVISVPTARRQAKAAGKPFLEEATMLLAHGLLHLLGWDHDTPSRDRAMRAETDRLCAASTPPGRKGGKRNQRAERGRG